MVFEQRNCHSLRHGFVCAVVLCLMSGLASAQTIPPGGLPPPRPERPYRDLFGESGGTTSTYL